MQHQHRDKKAPTPAGVQKRSHTAPGKRPLSAAVPNTGRAPIQRQSAGVNPRVGSGPSAESGDSTDVVFRPDLHSGPAHVVQRKAAAGVSTEAAAAASAENDAAPAEAQARTISFESLTHWVQSSLNVLDQRARLMDQPLVVDGKNGPRTRAAVKAFQRNAQALGAPEALDDDGLVGPRTTLGLEAATGTTNPAGRPADKTGGTEEAKNQTTQETEDPGTNQAQEQTAGNKTGQTTDVVHEEGKETEEEKSADGGGDAAVEAPSSLSSKALEKYFNDCLAARYGDKGMLSQMIQIKVSSYKVKSDPDGATVSQNAAAAWQEVAGAIDALTTDTRAFAIQLAIAMGGESATQYATCKVSFSRRKMTRSDDATIAASLIKADASHCTGGVRRVAEETYEAFKGLYAAAQSSGFIAEFPDFCKISSAYRSVATQEKLYADKVASLMAEGQSEEDAKKNARKWVASPGGSAHHTGHALDLEVWPDKLSSSNAKKMMDKKSSFHQKYSKYWIWLKENAPRYGFLPYAAEPWHWEKCK